MSLNLVNPLNVGRRIIPYIKPTYASIIDVISSHTYIFSDDIVDRPNRNIVFMSNSNKDIDIVVMRQHKNK